MCMKIPICQIIQTCSSNSDPGKPTSSSQYQSSSLNFTKSQSQASDNQKRIPIDPQSIQSAKEQSSCKIISASSNNSNNQASSQEKQCHRQSKSSRPNYSDIYNKFYLRKQSSTSCNADNNNQQGCPIVENCNQNTIQLDDQYKSQKQLYLSEYQQKNKQQNSTNNRDTKSPSTTQVLKQPCNYQANKQTQNCIIYKNDSSESSKTKSKLATPSSSYENIFNINPSCKESLESSKNSSNNHKNCQNSHSSDLKSCNSQKQQKIMCPSNLKQTSSSIIGNFAISQPISATESSKQTERYQGSQECTFHCPQDQNQQQKEFQKCIIAEEKPQELPKMEFICAKKQSFFPNSPSDPSQSLRNESKACKSDQGNNLKEQDQIFCEGAEVPKSCCLVPPKEGQKQSSPIIQEQSLEASSKEYKKYHPKCQQIQDPSIPNENEQICSFCENKEMIEQKKLQQRCNRMKEDYESKLIVDAIYKNVHSQEVAEMVQLRSMKQELIKDLKKQIQEKCEKKQCEQRERAEFEEAEKKRIQEAFQNDICERIDQQTALQKMKQSEMLQNLERKYQKMQQEKNMEEQYKKYQEKINCEAEKREQEEEKIRNGLKQMQFEGLRSQIMEKHDIKVKEEEREKAFFRKQEEMQKQNEAKTLQYIAEIKAKNIRDQMETQRIQQKFKETQKNQELCQDRWLEKIEAENNRSYLQNEVVINREIEDLKKETLQINMQQIREKANRHALEKKKEEELERQLQASNRRKEEEILKNMRPCDHCNKKFQPYYLKLKKKVDLNGACMQNRQQLSSTWSYFGQQQ